MFRSQREPDPFVIVAGRGRGAGAVWLCTGHFVVFSPRSPRSSLPFMISFLFIVEPESLVHNGPVRGMRASTRCLSLFASLAAPPFLSSRFLPRRNEKRLASQSGVTDAGQKWKIDAERGCMGPHRLVVRNRSFSFFSFFFFFPRTKCLSFDELASSDLFRLSRSMDRVVNRYS